MAQPDGARLDLRASGERFGKAFAQAPIGMSLADTEVFKASRGIEDIYELTYTYLRKDGSRFPAVVSVTALRDGQGGIIDCAGCSTGVRGTGGQSGQMTQERR
jgi:hypothetical protein